MSRWAKGGGTTNPDGSPKVFTSGVRYEVGAWVYFRTIQGVRPVTVLGYDKDGYVLYAEGHIDVRSTHDTNITLDGPERSLA